MTPIEDKIRKLLALASDPATPVEEARTAAMHAARLMREHKLEVGAAMDQTVAPVVGGPLASPEAFALGVLINMIKGALERAIESRPRPPRPPRTPFDDFRQRFESEQKTTQREIDDFWERYAAESRPPRKTATGTKPKKRKSRKQR